MIRTRRVGSKCTARAAMGRAAGRILTIVAITMLLSACGGGSPTAPSGGTTGAGTSSGGAGSSGGGNTGGGGGTTGGGGPMSGASLIGTWRVLTSSGVDVTGLNATWTVTATTLVENYPGLCQKSYSYTATATTISSTVTANSCNFQGANEPVGFQGTSTYAFSNNNNTLTVTVPATGAVGTLQRIG